MIEVVTLLLFVTLDVLLLLLVVLVLLEVLVLELVVLDVVAVEGVIGGGTTADEDVLVEVGGTVLTVDVFVVLPDPIIPIATPAMTTITTTAITATIILEFMIWVVAAPRYFRTLSKFMKV